MPSDSPTADRPFLSVNGLEAHGRAALLLVESLVHGLIERKLITVAHAVEIIDVAADVAGEIDHAAPGRKPETLLRAVSNSLRLDLPLEQ